MISIIIVNYHVKQELFACIASIVASNPKSAYEIIVVDNDEEKTIEPELKIQFKNIIYIENQNNGYGEGCNIGAHHARGEYLFFLNPDTLVYKTTIDKLYTYLSSHRDVGIVAPLLLDSHGQVYQLQGTRMLTPFRAIFSLSFIQKILPQNIFYKSYYLFDWDKKKERKVDSVPGTAFMIHKKLFDKLNGFDEAFFLYFEEFDLCKRAKALGYIITILPQVRVMHHWGRSTKKSSSNINAIFRQSRFYYFRKHYGLLTALFTESVMRIDKNVVLFSIILLFALFTSFYKIDAMMIFIGDQGWYYLSARDVLLQGHFPLVGIPSSHPWLHQGAFWTYLLVPVLGLSHFNPLSGGYLSIIIHLFTIYCLYAITKRFFSVNIALIAALLYASSPLIVLHARMPYHTTPIPLLSVLFYFAITKWIMGNAYYFPVIIFLLALLYNFEIATFLLTVVLLFTVGMGFINKSVWLKKTQTKKIFFLSIVAFIVPMLPMLIYDMGHGFPQTVTFLAWVGYKILVVFGYPPLNPGMQESGYISLLLFFAEAYKNLIFSHSNLVSFTLAICSFGYFGRKFVLQIKNRSYHPEVLQLGLIIVISITGIVTAKTASFAYLPLLYPFIILITAIYFEKLLQIRFHLRPIIILVLLIIAVANSYYLIQQNYFTAYGLSFKDRQEAVKKIVTDAGYRRYNLFGRGIGSEYDSFLMNYQYLAWFQGNEPILETQLLQYTIEDTQKGIIVTKNNKNL